MFIENFSVVSGTIPATGNATGQAALPVSGTPVVSTNTIDTGSANSFDLGEGEEVYMVFNIVTAYTLLTSLTLEIIGATDTALSTGIVSLGSLTVPLASLTAGAWFAVRVQPQIGVKGIRYLGARYSTSGTTPGAGAVCAYLTLDIQDGKKFYSSGFSVT
jgi:hypothetical protein